MSLLNATLTKWVSLDLEMASEGVSKAVRGGSVETPVEAMGECYRRVVGLIAGFWLDANPGTIQAAIKAFCMSFNRCRRRLGAGTHEGWPKSRCLAATLRVLC